MEFEILCKIITLTQDKIWSLLEKLHRPEVQATIDRAIGEVNEQESFLDNAKEVDFRHWIRNLHQLAYLRPGSNFDRLIPHIKWASEARWVYSEQLETFLGSAEGQLPPWLKHVYKLGRYYAATKAMLKLAMKQSALFTRIHVEPVQAPEQVEFSLGGQQTPLLTVLKKITKADPQKLRENLGQTWFTKDPEAKLRRACRMTLTVHAEMQLLSFYDHSPDYTPRLQFMGTSKKACYLCDEFMSRHPLNIGVSASHQKLYPTWMPPPCSSAVRKKHKTLLWEFSRYLEQTTARDLETRLGMKRPYNMDSTDGPSLTTTGTVSMEPWDQELSLRLLGGDEKAAPEVWENTVPDEEPQQHSVTHSSFSKPATISGNLQRVGGLANFWLYSTDSGWDLTHPSTPESPPIYPRISLETTTGNVVVDPEKTALVVVDLQNYFLSPALGRPTDAVGLQVVDRLLESTIPACRKAKIPIVWLGWGLTDQDIDTMPPTIVEGFAADGSFARGKRRIGPVGTEIGLVALANGTVIHGGRALIKHQWNTALYAPLAKKADAGQDIWVYKNRPSGFWGGTGIEESLRARGIRTLLFSGANTDQGVGGSIQDASARGWDCLMLSDACATTSPGFATEMVEYNTAGGWGFVSTTEQLVQGVRGIQM